MSQKKEGNLVVFRVVDRDRIEHLIEAEYFRIVDEQVVIFFVDSSPVSCFVDPAVVKPVKAIALRNASTELPAEAVSLQAEPGGANQKKESELFMFRIVDRDGGEHLVEADGFHIQSEEFVFMVDGRPDRYFARPVVLKSVQVIALDSPRPPFATEPAPVQAVPGEVASFDLRSTIEIGAISITCSGALTVESLGEAVRVVVGPAQGFLDAQRGHVGVTPAH